MHLSPSYEFIRASIKCSNCGEKLKVTNLSKLIFIFTIILNIVLVLSFASMFQEVSKFVFICFMSIALISCYFLYWPFIIKTAKWTPYEYWLPKSRVVGYSVYLLLPLSVIVGLISLGIYFEWGM